MTSADGRALAVDLARQPDFSVGGLIVRPSACRVVSPEGERRIERKVMEVLLALVAGEGATVSRDDLIDACWGGRVVSDDAVNRAVAQVRALARGVDPAPFTVETIPKVGFRLLASTGAAEPELAGAAGEAPPVSESPAERQVEAAAEPLPHPSQPVAFVGEGERRHVAALFCDIVGAAKMAARLDPEDWREIASAYQHAAAEVVGRFGGHASRQAGDGVVAYFGYPRAQENAAERAVLAGLTLVEAMAGLNQTLGGRAGAPLQVRAGIHCGTVVITHSDSGDLEVFGDAPNVAAQMKSLAPADSVLISEAVRALVPDRFELDDLGPTMLDGAQAPVRLLRVLRPGPPSRRRNGGRSHVPMIGRADERRLLLGRWERTRAGAGQVVLLMGEPGIGKTRLVEEFRSLAAGAPTLEAAGGPFFANSPFHPVVQLLEQILRRGSAQTRRRRLDKALGRAGVGSREAAPLIAELLGLPVPDPPMLAPEHRRARLMAALTDWVLEAARSEPLLLIVEDLHWLDPSSLEVLQTLVEQGDAAPLMLLLTARPEFRAPWSQKAHHANLALARLDVGESRALVESVAAGAALAPGVMEAVIERTDGVPLFVEELTRLMAGRAAPASDDIPASLRDSLAARLDRLGSAREAAQVAAVIGREFSYELLAAVWPKSEPELVAHLAALADAELIQARGSPPKARYRFRHGLVQTAAYETLLKRHRRQLHAEVAEAIEGRFAALATAQPEVLARHWSEAGATERALEAWKAAGDAASARRAFTEAEAAYRHALAEVAALEASPERDHRELELTGLLGRVLQVTRGYAAPEAIDMARRARTLAEDAGSLNQLIREEARIWNAVITTGDYAGAAALAERLQDLIGDQRYEPRRQLFELNAQIQIRFYTGDLAGSEDHYLRLAELIEAVQPDQAASNVMIALGVAGLNAAILGRPDDARSRAVWAQQLAERGRNPYDVALSLHFLGLLRALENSSDEAAARRMLALCEENGFFYLADLARGHLGWAIGQTGRPEEGAEMMRRAWTSISAMRANLGMTLGLALLADVEARAGAVDKSLASLEEALACNPQELVFRPEILRRRAELRLARGEAELAAADLDEALSIARRIGATSWELRARGSLARLAGVSA
jgi:class 3 adenylate cyclase